MIGTALLFHRGIFSARALKAPPIRFPAAFFLAAGALAVLAPLRVRAAADTTPVEASPAVPAPTLHGDTAIYQLDAGVLQYAFTFTNPSDSVLYLDCQVPPRASMSGSTLVLDFDRRAMPAPGAGDSAAVAGGPAQGGSPDANDFPPQRIGAHQTFQGQRRLDRVLGDYHARPKFSGLQLRMAYYPERDSGNGEPFLIDRQRKAASRILTVVKKGKPPVPPKVIRRRVRAPG